MTVTPTHDGALRVTCDECGREVEMPETVRDNDAIDAWLEQHGWRSELWVESCHADVDDFCPECVARAAEAAEAAEMEGDDTDA